MRRSELFLPSRRDAAAGGSATTNLLVRSGLVADYGSGLWGFTPAGQRIRRKVTGRLRAAMDAVGGQEVRLPVLQHRDRWAESGRWESFEGEMFTIRDRDDRELCLAPSHEEAMVHLVDGRVRSYDDLPLLVYQVGRKFRDDRARNGLVRTREFTMKDAYSFHADADGTETTYRTVRAAYERALSDLGVEFAIVDADSGVMGGSTSEEFIAPAAGGSDRLRHCTADGCRFGTVEDDKADEAGNGTTDDHTVERQCPDCGGRLVGSDGIEVAHIFDLGRRYADPMGLSVDGVDGTEQPVHMASYGVGADRLIETIAAQHADEDGLRWPESDWGTIAPYRAAVVPVGEDGGARAVAKELHEACGRSDVLLFDDPDQSVGERFAESRLLGIPATVVVGNGYRETGLVDVENRAGETRQLTPDDVPQAVARYAAGRPGEGV